MHANINHCWSYKFRDNDKSWVSDLLSEKKDPFRDEDFSALSLIKNPINHQIVLQIGNSIVREGSLRERVFDKLRNILAAKFVQLDAKSITWKELLLHLFADIQWKF